MANDIVADGRLNSTQVSSKNLDSSLKRNTAFIKKLRQSLGTENHDQLMKDIESLSLEKYVDELPSGVIEGISRCKTEKDVWSAVEVRASSFTLLRLLNAVVKVISALNRRFPTTFTPALVSALNASLAAPSKAALSALSQEQREKEDSTRVARQRPVLRVCAELALVGIIRDAPGRSGGEWIMKVIRELVRIS